MLAIVTNCIPRVFPSGGGLGDPHELYAPLITALKIVPLSLLIMTKMFLDILSS